MSCLELCVLVTFKIEQITICSVFLTILDDLNFVVVFKCIFEAVRGISGDGSRNKLFEGVSKPNKYGLHNVENCHSCSQLLLSSSCNFLIFENQRNLKELSLFNAFFEARSGNHIEISYGSCL